MKKNSKFIASFLSAIFFCSFVGCADINISNQEIIELTKDNWEKYLTYQKNSDTTPVTTRNLYGITLYESSGTFTVKFYSKFDAKYENVNISLSLQIYTIAYSSAEKSSIALSDRIPDDWRFSNEPYPTKDSFGGTTWEKIKRGTLSTDGEISFSEPCEMLYSKPLFGGVFYDSLEDAINVYVKEISGQVIIKK